MRSCTIALNVPDDIIKLSLCFDYDCDGISVATANLTFRPNATHAKYRKPNTSTDSRQSTMVKQDNLAFITICHNNCPPT